MWNYFVLKEFSNTVWLMKPYVVPFTIFIRISYTKLATITAALHITLPTLFPEPDPLVVK